MKRLFKKVFLFLKKSILFLFFSLFIAGHVVVYILAFIWLLIPSMIFGTIAVKRLFQDFIFGWNLTLLDKSKKIIRKIREIKE